MDFSSEDEPELSNVGNAVISEVTIPEIQIEKSRALPLFSKNRNNTKYQGNKEFYYSYECFADKWHVDYTIPETYLNFKTQPGSSNKSKAATNKSDNVKSESDKPGSEPRENRTRASAQGVNTQASAQGVNLQASAQGEQNDESEVSAIEYINWINGKDLKTSDQNSSIMPLRLSC